ncbi:MAG: ATP-binding protein [Caulobacteraceae bacterium]|nr:ATP-binding protein [Caulobacteraceae bacterium]
MDDERTLRGLLGLAESLSGVGYWRLMLEEGRLFWSDETFQIHGVGRDAFRPDTQNVLDFYHHDDRAAAIYHLDRAVRRHLGFEYEARLVRPDGQVRTIFSKGCCERDEDGNPVAIIGVVQDVTARKIAEAVERENAQRLGRFIERLPAGAVHVRSGALTMNAELERITGYSREELPTLKAWFNKLYGDDGERRLARYEQARREGFKSIVHGVIRRRDGEQRVLELRACDDPSGEIWIVHDVTDREAMQAELMAAKDRAEVAARAKSEFLANMSHELRTPLTAIIGFTGLLAGQGGVGETERRWVARIDDAGKALLAIVNDVLDFSKLEAGSVTLEAEAFEPRRLVEETVALLQDQADGKGVTIQVAVDDSVGEVLMGDAGRLRQILINLVSNAVKFTHHGQVRVIVGPAVAADGSAQVGFSVADTGIGIPEEALGQIFQRFVQADGSISRRFGGTGLGLAISARLVELMGGEIGVHSRLGEGSTFWFTVPLDRATAMTANIETSAPANMEALRVLLVEDAEANQELVTTLLTAVGVDVTVACNGAEAVEAVRADCFELILMDVQMPVMGGVEATRVIRAMGGDLAHIPIIALSANVLPEQVADYHQAGMSAHLAKPINPRDLLAAIARWTEPCDGAEPVPQTQNGAA